MTAVWMLVKDHFNRKATLLICFSLILGLQLFINTSHRNGDYTLASSLSWVLYMYYANLGLSFSMHSETKVIRLWRTLPFRETSLATLTWAVAVVGAPLFAFVLALGVEVISFACFGRTYMDWLGWPFLFLLLTALCAGLFAFLSASMRFEYARAMRARPSRPARFLLNPHLWHTAVRFAYAFTVGMLVFYPIPNRWSDITPRHVLGIALAVHLTWESYQLRSWLLHPYYGQGHHPAEAAKPESTPHSSTSLGMVLTQELLTIGRRTLLIVLGSTLLSCLLFFVGARVGLLTSTYNHNAYIPQEAFTLPAVFAAMLVLGQIGRVAELKAIRSFPVTTNQCVALILSYPYAASITAIPCLAVLLWLSGLTPFLAVLGMTFIFCASMCPVAVLVVLLFGPRGYTILFVLLIGYVVLLPMKAVFSYPNVFTLPSISLPTACLLLGGLGLMSGFALRHLVENSSAVYKHTMFPQQFGQR